MSLARGKLTATAEEERLIVNYIRRCPDVSGGGEL